jgi:BMFP domain-containing protein YqiC
MEITNVITETVKDVVAISKSVAKVVKDEVEMYFDNKQDEDIDGESADSMSKSLFEYFGEFETKFKEMLDTSFAGFKTSKSEDQEELEARISALEEKLSKLVEESLEALKKDNASRI